MGMGPGTRKRSSAAAIEAERLAKERLDQRLGAALQRGWSVRWGRPM